MLEKKKGKSKMETIFVKDIDSFVITVVTNEDNNIIILL